MTKKQQIQLFEDKKVRVAWDDELEQWFFSVIDVVQVLTDSEDVKQYIKKMRSRDPELNVRWGTICTPTRMMAADRSPISSPAVGVARVLDSTNNSKVCTRRTCGII